METENQTTPEVPNSPLHMVTPLSKYLAMALFVAMPFVGGWIGYQFAPEKVVEVEKEMIKEVTIEPEIYIEGTCSLTDDIYAVMSVEKVVDSEERTLAVRSHTNGLTGTYDLPDFSLGAGLRCTELTDGTYDLEVVSGELGMFVHYHHILDSTGELIKIIDVSNDSNGAWGARKSMGVSSNEYFYIFKDETKDIMSEKRVVLLEFSEDVTCRYIQDCLSSEYLMNILSDTVYQFNKDKMAFGYDHKVINSGTIEVIAEWSPMSAESREGLEANTETLFLKSLDI